MKLVLGVGQGDRDASCQVCVQMLEITWESQPMDLANFFFKANRIDSLKPFIA